MLFTYNPEFRQDRNTTARRATLVQHFDDCLKEIGIDAKRIVYVGKEKGESRSYVSAPSEAWRFLPGASPGRGMIKADCP